MSTLLKTTSGTAQQLLSEGVLLFNIRITGDNIISEGGTAHKESQSGKLLIYIKEDNIRQDFSMDNGYNYSRIMNYSTRKEIVLQEISTMKYAIETNINDFLKKSDPYRNAVLRTNAHQSGHNGFRTVSATLTYRDSSSMQFSYVPDYWLAHPGIFEKMPELKGIPAVFDLPLSNGFTTHFELSAIRREPISNTIFRIPEGYRIINRKEYEKLIK